MDARENWHQFEQKDNTNGNQRAKHNFQRDLRWTPRSGYISVGLHHLGTLLGSATIHTDNASGKISFDRWDKNMQRKRAKIRLWKKRTRHLLWTIKEARLYSGADLPHQTKCVKCKCDKLYNCPWQKFRLEYTNLQNYRIK